MGRSLYVTFSQAGAAPPVSISCIFMRIGLHAMRLIKADAFFNTFVVMVSTGVTPKMVVIVLVQEIN